MNGAPIPAHCAIARHALHVVPAVAEAWQHWQSTPAKERAREAQGGEILPCGLKRGGLPLMMLTVLADGRIYTHEALQRALDASGPAISKVGRGLIEMGFARRVKHGVYQATNAGQAAIAAL